MKYVLMHKTIPVVDIELDEHTSSISAIGKVYAENAAYRYLPRLCHLHE